MGQVTLLLSQQHQQDNEHLIKIAGFLTRQPTHKNLLGEINTLGVLLVFAKTCKSELKT